MTMIENNDDAKEDSHHDYGIVVVFLDIDGVLLPFGGGEEGEGEDKDDDTKNNDQEANHHNHHQEDNKKKQSAVSSSCSGLFPDRTLDALNSIMKHASKTSSTTTSVSSKQGVHLVLSSTWRVKQEFCDQILKAFQEYNNTFGGLLPDKFYDVTDVNTHTERQWEIHDWLYEKQNNKNGHSSDDTTTTTTTAPSTILAWIALDDEELLEEEKNAKYRSEFEGHVVKTTSSIGLTKQHAETAIRLLKQQQKKRKR